MNFSVRWTWPCGVHVALGAPLAMRSRSATRTHPAHALRVEIERDERADRAPPDFDPSHGSDAASPHLRSPDAGRAARVAEGRETQRSRTICSPAYDASVWIRARSPVKRRCCDSVVPSGRARAM